MFGLQAVCQRLRCTHKTLMAYITAGRLHPTKDESPGVLVLWPPKNQRGPWREHKAPNRRWVWRFDDGEVEALAAERRAQQAALDAQKALTPPEVARRLQVTPQTVHAWVRDGTIHAERVPWHGKVWRWVCSEEDVARIAATRTTPKGGADPDTAAEILAVDRNTIYELIRLKILRAKRERHKHGRRSVPLLTLDLNQVIATCDPNSRMQLAHAMAEIRCGGPARGLAGALVTSPLGGGGIVARCTRARQADDDCVRPKLPPEFKAPGHPGRGGRPALSIEAKAALWAVLPAAIGTLVSCLDTPNAMVRRQAADSIVDRTLGKPTVPVEVRVGVDWSRVPPDMLEAYVSLYTILLERFPAKESDCYLDDTSCRRREEPRG